MLNKAMKEAYITGDTIVALATAPLPAGVAIVRLSGPQAWPVAQAIMPTFIKAKPRMAVVGPVVAHTTHGVEVLDHALALGFIAPASFTGEDVVELHLHGAPTVVARVLNLLERFEGVRAALPGEFSRRAVLNGKMDLTTAEGIADLIAAQTEAQRKQATRLLQGEQARLFESWRTRILGVLAQVEAALDFPDEELDILADSKLLAGLHEVLTTLNDALHQRAGERVREGVRLAIIGRPNAGKSTLLNVLAGRAAAIVSPTPGTTRDVVGQNLELGGYPVTVLDTAGLRTTTDSVEAEGIKRAKHTAAEADVLVAVVSAEDWPDVHPDVLDVLVPEHTLIVVSKADLTDAEITGPLVVKDTPDTSADETFSYPVLAADLTAPDVLGRLYPALVKLVQGVAGAAAQGVVATRARHRAAMQAAVAALGQALVHLQRVAAPGYAGPNVAELVAHDLREAAAAIGSITGRTGSEDVLDVVFSTFCIGK
jgi:tRNA modification GTPase